MNKLQFSLFFTFFLLMSLQIRSQEAPPNIELWRLDCGFMYINDISYFSDAFEYEGQSVLIGNGCYLVRNGDRYLLWDAGIASEFLGNKTPEGGWLSYIERTLVSQLGDLALEASNIDFLGVSHFHGDHIGQAAEFSNSTLLMNSRDVAAIKASPNGNAIKRLAHWFSGDSELVEFRADYDVFGDGSVTVLATPGHTPGHSSLLVRLPETGPVLLTGDLFHFKSEIGTGIVSRWNTSRADTLASHARFAAIVRSLNPLVIIQHDLQDMDLLPAFPESAK